MKSISNLITHKTVNRMVRNQFGERYYEERTFEMKYNPTIENYGLRILAKFIDYFLYLILAFVFYKLFHYNFRNFKELMAAGVMLLFIINPLFEAKNGKSIGKLIAKIQIIDDFGNTPTYLLAYKRNFFTLAVALVPLQIIPRKLALGGDVHNKICKTYVIYDKDLPKVKSFIEKESVIEN